MSTFGRRGALVTLHADPDDGRWRVTHSVHVYPDMNSGRKCSARQSATVTIVPVGGSMHVTQLNSVTRSVVECEHDRHTIELETSPRVGTSSGDAVKRRLSVARRS